ncbi:MAG: IS3 family transposase [Planctomycetota bacterium]
MTSTKHRERDTAGHDPAPRSGSEVGAPAARLGPVPPALREEILAQVASGRKALDVAREYGVHNSTISGWRRKIREKSTRGAAAASSARRENQETSPPRETGRYSMEFKREVLSQVRSGRKIVEVARQYQLPSGTIGRWKHEAKESGGEVLPPKSSRPPLSVSPIDEKHRKLVLELKAMHANMGLAQVQNQLKRFHALRLSRHMIGRIFREAGIPLQKRSPRSDTKPSENRFEMTRPGELWAVDFKEFWVHSEKAYALSVLDDFSRFLVGFALTRKPTAELAIETLRRAIQRYGRPERILSDRGPQFHSWNGVSQFDEFLADFLTDHTVTKADHPFTNGKIESLHRTIEAEILDVEEFASLEEAERRMRSWIAEYNFSRTHMGIGGLVPADRYFGMVEEAERALTEGLETGGPGLRWLGALVSRDGTACRQPTLLQFLLRDGKLELVVLGRRFTLS